MRRFLALFFSFALVLSLGVPSVFAQEGPCAADGSCPTGQICDEFGTSGRLCWKTCTPAPVGVLDHDTGCASGQICASPPGGPDVCVSATGELDFSSTVETVACSDSRPCPGEQQCVEGTCRVADGAFCTTDEQCRSGSYCNDANPRQPICARGSRPESSGGLGEVSSEGREFEPITPRLGAPIPGVSLSAPSQSEGITTIPFLVEYINAGYRYLVGVVLVAAIIMVVYGGFRYLVGASYGDITRGKEIIRDAIVGMLLVITAYLILNTINPATTTLNTIQLASVAGEPFDIVLDFTQENTIIEDRGADSSLPGTTAPSGPGYSSTFSDCPVSLTSEATRRSPTEPRSTEFSEEILEEVTASDVRQRILQIAEAAARCGVHFGSCGRTVITINGIADVSGRGRTDHTITNDQMLYLDTINCDRGSERSCYRSAKAQAYEKLQREIPGWPNDWINDLEPGDAFTVFNANSSRFGTHAAIFTGWESNGRAKVVQGAYGNLVSEGTICLIPNCGNPNPIVRTFKPD